MKKVLIVFAAILLYCGPPAAQDLPPDMLADQYLLPRLTALQRQDRQAAISAFQKIEALDVTPPAEFFYFYGKVLVENGIATGNGQSIEKGQSLLKKYVVDLGREAEYYHSALEVLNMAEGPVEEAKAAKAAQRRQREAAKRRRQERSLAILAQVDAQMVRVEGGSFTMGCTREQRDCDDDEKPAHQVRISSFEMSKYEVTREVWEAVMGEKPSRFKDCPQCPVERVSWNDVQGFLQKLNAGGGRYRLPSEAEWEYAARGGSQSRGYKYAGSDHPNAVAWYKENSGGKTYLVGQKQANEVGLYDLSGNVYEWVQDCWNETYQGAPSDGRAWERGDCNRRILRGGSWINIPGFLRSANRVRDTADVRYYLFGFRIARSLP